MIAERPRKGFRQTPDDRYRLSLSWAVYHCFYGIRKYMQPGTLASVDIIAFPNDGGVARMSTRIFEDTSGGV